jgi:hypothetical protein
MEEMTITKVMYHTQEKKIVQLIEPILCVRDDAWLGEAYYLWQDENDAVYWGLKSKRKTGYFEIYNCTVDLTDVLDTVFNEEHYNFWVRQIEKAAKSFVVKAKVKPSLKEINDYFFSKGIWSKFSGILFQDISNNPDHFFVKQFQYKKRIQLAVYNLHIISNFTLHYEGKCV